MCKNTEKKHSTGVAGSRVSSERKAHGLGTKVDKQSGSMEYKGP